MEVQTDIHKDLIEKSKKGVSAAQYKLYSLYAKAMYNTCYRMMHSKETAEDMLQEAFTDAFMKLKSFRYESTFGAWLKRITVNKCINEIKRKKLELAFMDDLSPFGEKADEEVQSDGLSVQAIKQVLPQLPSGNRMIFTLYLLEGYDHREISSILNISESNSKSQYMRAKRKIRELLNTRLYEN